MVVEVRASVVGVSGGGGVDGWIGRVWWGWGWRVVSMGLSVLAVLAVGWKVCDDW